MRCDRDALLLYAVTDRNWLNGRTLAAQVEDCLRGGVTMLQLREKELTEPNFLAEAVAIERLCRARSVPFIVNDSVDVAILSGADGAHVGQHDLDAGEVRRRLGPGRLLGVSVQTVEQAIAAERIGADYLGVGAVFPTSTKLDADAVDRAALAAICRAVSIPVVAIGGITEDNIAQLRGCGLAGVAVVSALFAQDNILSAARRLRARAEEMVRA